MITPISENNADESTLKLYTDLKTALEVRTIPLFFTYIGAFPEYHKYIADQLAENLKSPTFKELTEHIGTEISIMIEQQLKPGTEIKEWFTRYKNSPSIYYFKQDVGSIFLTNVRLAFVFIAIREAIKGWAIAAKQLPGQTYQQQAPEKAPVKQDDFIFEDIADHSLVVKPNSQTSAKQTQATLTMRTNALTKRENFTIEKDLLLQYLNLCKYDFYQHMKTAEFWQIRIELEKKVLSSLSIMPHIIFSPVNVVIDLTKKYKTFPDLLYLLSEHFPTYSIQRMIFSGCMVNYNY